MDGQVSWLAGPRPVALAFPDRSSDAARRGGTDDGLAAYSCGHSRGFSPRSPNRPAPMIAPPRTARKGAVRGPGVAPAHALADARTDRLRIGPAATRFRGLARPASRPVLTERWLSG